MLIATIDSSIVIIAMPAIFRGVHLDPLGKGNSFSLLWMMLGYLIVTSGLGVAPVPPGLSAGDPSFQNYYPPQHRYSTM